MGPKQSVASLSSQQKAVITISHPMFANTELIKVSEQQLQVRTHIRLANKQQFLQWERRIKFQPQNECLMLPISQYYAEQELCGKSGHAVITYQNFPYLLKDQIANRKHTEKQIFEQSQLWYLMYTILAAASLYHKKGHKVGDIRPENIFLSENGQIKVGSIDSWPGELTNYEKSFYEKQITYLAPEQIKDYQFGKVQESCNFELAQSFSIGLTILAVATLSYSHQFYTKNLKLDFQTLQTKIQQLKKQPYTQELILTIQGLCQVDTEFRLVAQKLYLWLKTNEDEIVTLKEFKFSSLPKEILEIKQRNKETQSQALNKKTTTISMYSKLNPSSLNYESLPLTHIRPFATSIPLPAQLPNIFNYTLPSLSNYQLSNAASLYNKGKYEGSLTYSEPQMSGLTQKLQIQPSHTSTSYNMKKQLLGFQQRGLNKSPQVNQFTLQQIDKQLQMSRKMFPS